MRRSAALALLMLVASGCSGSRVETNVGDAGRLEQADREPHNWLSHGRDYAEQRFSPLTQIDASNVAGLGLAWSYDLDTARGQEATPLVVDGVMYTTTAWSKVVALDAATGRHLWTHDPEVPGAFGAKSCCDVVNRGAAYYAGKIFVGTIDGRLIALDARTGKLLWSVVTVDQSKPYTITGAPRVVRGKVLIGNGGAEFGVRGYVSAYDADTGALAWRFYTVPGDPAKEDGAASDASLRDIARPTWFGDKYWQYGGGGTVWDSIVYDQELNQLYIGVGNGSPWNRQHRSEDKGDNLFLSSIVALDPDSGKYLWHYQETPGETWDFTATQQIILTELEIDGRRRKVIMHAPKNGFFYVIDRSDGRLISAEKFVPVNWAERIDLKTGRPVENPDARFRKAPFVAMPGGAGAHNWHPMAFSPRTGLVYIPAQQIPYVYTTAEKFKYVPGRLNLGLATPDLRLPTAKADIDTFMGYMKGELVAWDPVRQKAAWRVPHGGTWNGGVLATAGDLVFQGLADGSLRAYHATTGKELWSFDAQTALLPGPISYSVDGVQYIAVMAGNGGAFALSVPNFGAPRPRINGRVLVFKLDGTARLPAVDAETAALVSVPLDWPAEKIAEGRRLFTETCSACHGVGALSGGVVPDLRRSQALADRDVWKQIVVDGALSGAGMISFAQYLSPAQAESIRGYVACRASADPALCDK